MNILFVVITILTTIISVKLFTKASGSMSIFKLNTISYVFYFQIITSSLVASVLLVTGVLDYHPDLKLVSENVKLEAWLWTMYSIIAMPIGMIGLSKVFNIDVIKTFNQYINKKTIIPTINIKWILIFLTLFSFLTLAYIFLKTDRVALYTLLVEHNPEQARLDRITSRLNFGGIIYIKNLLGYIMIPVIAYYSYIIMRIKKTMFYKVIFVVNFFLAILMVAHDTQKAPIAFFILGFWIVEVIINNGINLKKAGLFLGLPVLLILVGYTLTTGVDGLDQFTRFNSAFYGRTFVGSYLGFPLSLELFPDKIIEQTYALGIPHAIGEKLGLDLTESARLLMKYVHYEAFENGTGNLYSSFYMGEAWANYGYLGLIMAPFIVGFVIQSVHLYLLSKPKEALLIAFYALITVRWLVGSGFVNFLYLKQIIFPFVLYFIFKFILNQISNYKV